MQAVLILLLKYKYWILFPLAAIEGPVVSILVGFLVYSGIFSFWPAFIILLFGDIVPDTIYFYIGYFSDRSKFIQKHFLQSEFFVNNFSVIRKLWNKHPNKTMIFGKLAYGMAIPFLISAGMVKMSYKKFISYTIPITMFQYGVIMFIGYYLGSSYERGIKYIDYAYFLLAFFVIIFIIFYILLAKYAQRKIISMEKEETN